MKTGGRRGDLSIILFETDTNLWQQKKAGFRNKSPQKAAIAL